MKRNETTSLRVARIASKVLKGKKITLKETKSLAGSVLTQKIKNKR